MTPAVPATASLPDRLWRKCGTAVAFSVFGLACVAFGFTLFPAACLTTRDPAVARRRAQWIVHRWFRFFAGLMKRLGLIRVEIRGGERLRQPGRMIVANHPTLIDVVLLIAQIPEVDCIVKRGVLRNPFMRWPARWAGYIGNDHPEQLVADCAASLKKGHSLLVFPEGTRSIPGQPLRMTHGAARIALEADAQVLPVTVSCEPAILHKGVPWHYAPRQGHFVITVGEPYPVAPFREGAASTAIAARRLTHHWEQYFAARTGGTAAHPLAPTAPQPQYSSSAAAAPAEPFPQ